jgi:ABC-2 type transport system ATP-binding protein
MIKVKNLTQYYGPHKAIDNLSFNITPGKLVGFLGPNGAGKTTTMKILSGFALPFDGEVWIDNINLFSNPVEAKRKIGYLPEAPPLYEDMSVAEYLLFVCQLKGVPRTECSGNVREVIERVHLTEVAHRPIHRLSKGFRQRVGLAQALVAKPQIIILDEPTVGFDPQQAREFRHLLISLKKDYTILWSTHILSDVESTCDEVIVINKGQIIAQGSYQEITKKIHGKRQLQLFVKERNSSFEERVKAFGNISLQFNESAHRYDVQYGEKDITDQVLRVALDLQMSILKMESDSQDLESLFIELTSPVVTAGNSKTDSGEVDAGVKL